MQLCDCYRVEFDGCLNRVVLIKLEGEFYTAKGVPLISILDSQHLQGWESDFAMIYSSGSVDYLIPLEYID